MEYLELITMYQLNVIFLTLVIVSLTIGALFYYHTNDFKPGIISFLSVFLVPVFTIAILLIFYKYTDSQPSEKHTLIVWASLFINTLNLSTLISKYSREILKKTFDIDHVTRYHFNTTLNLLVILFVVLGAVSIFMYIDMLFLLISILTISILILWFNHLIARFLLKEK